MSTLDTLIEGYAGAKEKEAEIKTNCSWYNKTIKEELAKRGIDEYKGEEYTVVKSEINADKLDEDLLIEKIKESYPDLVSECVKTIQVIDLDRVEDLVYNRVLPADVVKSVTVHKPPTIRLNIKKTKKEKE